MDTLRTLQEIFREERLSILYALSPCPDWEHFDPTECPRPIREWITEHYPEVTIERATGFEIEQDGQGQEATASSKKTVTLFNPIFRIGFDDAQAHHFEEAWSTPPLRPESGAENFYFLVCTPGEETAILPESPSSDVPEPLPADFEIRIEFPEGWPFA